MPTVNTKPFAFPARSTNIAATARIRLSEPFRLVRPFLALLLAVCLVSSATFVQAETATRGQIIGGAAHSLPEWFKDSFLDIAEDVDEASADGKHVMLFFDLNGCPYCERMLSESFKTDPLSSYIQSHFDVIAINIQGDLEIAFNAETSVTEKQLARMLKVRATPALIFLNEKNETIVRVNGYRAPERFQQVLEFVATRSYQTTGLEDYLQAKHDRNVYQLRHNAKFTETDDLSGITGPLMLIIEDGSCYDCNEFHDVMLTDELVSAEIERLTIVRLDGDSNESLLDFDGNKTTPAEFARQYEMIYRPGVLVFNNGELLRRHDSLPYPHHLTESLRFVGGGYHKTTDYRTFVSQFREELLESGKSIDYGRTRTTR